MDAPECRTGNEASPERSVLLERLELNWPPAIWRDVTVLVAVSGGPDSVALMRALAHLRNEGEGRLILAHFNHRLRGAESDGDQAFVEELGGELGVGVIVGTRGGERERGREEDKSEESLRELRYEFLSRTADKLGARYVATAHTADDQVETVLFNILRGTGLAGLAGIPRARPLTAAATLIRPLLEVSRAEVLEYLAFVGQQFREDASNSIVEYKRNRIRHQLLPQLERDFNPQVRGALIRLSQIAGEADEFLREQAELVLSKAQQPIPGGFLLQFEPLARAHPTIVHQALMLAWRKERWPLQDMGFDHWENLRLLGTISDAAPMACRVLSLPGGVRAEARGSTIRVTRNG